MPNTCKVTRPVRESSVSFESVETKVSMNLLQTKKKPTTRQGKSKTQISMHVSSLLLSLLNKLQKAGNSYKTVKLAQLGSNPPAMLNTSNSPLLRNRNSHQSSTRHTKANRGVDMPQTYISCPGAQATGDRIALQADAIISRQAARALRDSSGRSIVLVAFSTWTHRHARSRDESMQKLSLLLLLPSARVAKCKDEE